MMRGMLSGLILVVTVGSEALAQDSIPPSERGVRIGITYAPGTRPGMLMLGGELASGLDSARTILGRDLEYSDQFEMITLPTGDSLTLRVGTTEENGVTEAFVNYPLYAALGAAYAVNLYAGPDSGVVITLYDVRGEQQRTEIRVPRLDPTEGDFRMRIHRAADEVVRIATGLPGIAATQILFINAGRIYRIDFDGHSAEALSPPGGEAMSPVWAPDARSVVYMEFRDDGRGPLHLLNLETGESRVVAPTANSQSQNFAPAFSPDGRTLAFSRANEEGTDIYAYNLADDCCLQRLTVGGFSDNLSPTYSPDGQRIAYESDRPGLSQIYVMSSDGTGQELFAPFDYGVSGSSHHPEWSPDGLSVAFDRYVARTAQIFLMDVGSRVVRQLTSATRNSDPTWAPDGRHMAFVSTRTGSHQVWVIDMETGRVRQLTRLGEARLPAWSPRIPERNNS